MFDLARTDILKKEKEHLKSLSKCDGIATDWAVFHSKTNPGFFTSFNQTIPFDYDNRTYQIPMNMGMKQAAIAASLLPTLQLQTALVSAVQLPAALLLTISNMLEGNWESAAYFGKAALATAAQTVYFSCAFVLNLVKEITAFITRSVATLIEMCMGSGKIPPTPHSSSQSLNEMDEGLRL